MKVLLDSCVPRPLRQFLGGHQVSTAQEVGWGQLKNGDLLSRAEGAFDVFVTADKNLVNQQDLKGKSLAILVLPTNDWTHLRVMGNRVAELLAAIGPGGYVEVPA